MHEKATVFRCQDDHLVGIYHRPPEPRGRVGILIVVGGPQYRVGSHRQFVQMARGFASGGYPVFRFDYRGMGDSSGAPRTFEAVGEDIRAAVDAFMTESPSLNGVVILGLCDAASAALMYVEGDARVKGLVLINPWVRTEHGEAKALIRHYYLRRLLQRSFWAKLGAGEFAFRASLQGFRRSVGKMLARTAGASGHDPASFLVRMERGLNAFHRPIMILISGKDLTAREFETLCREAPAWRELTARGSVQLSKIDDADHTFSAAGSLASAVNLVSRWLGSWSHS